MPRGMGGPKDLHGVTTDNGLLKKALDLGNWIRYGMNEDERMDKINKLSIPGIKDAAYTGPMKIYDPAAAERYGSAYLYGKRWPNLTGIGEKASDLFRRAGSAVGIPGMGEERPELSSAMHLGMERGRTGYTEDPNFNEAKPWESYHNPENDLVQRVPAPDPEPIPNAPASIADDPMRLAEELKLQKRRAASMLPQNLWND